MESELKGNLWLRAFSALAMKSYALVCGKPHSVDLIGHISLERPGEPISQMVSEGILDCPFHTEAVYDPRYLHEVLEPITGKGK